MSTKVKRNRQLIESATHSKKTKLQKLSFVPSGRAQLIHGGTTELSENGTRVGSIILDPSYGLNKSPKDSERET